MNLFIDILIFYAMIGLIINWIIGLIAIYDEEEVTVDGASFILTIPIWPLTLWNIIESLTRKG